MTDIDISHGISRVNHNHERNGFVVETTKMFENFLQRAIRNRGNTNQILADAIEQLTEGGRV